MSLFERRKRVYILHSKERQRNITIFLIGRNITIINFLKHYSTFSFDFIRYFSFEVQNRFIILRRKNKCHVSFFTLKTPFRSFILSLFCIKSSISTFHLVFCSICAKLSISFNSVEFGEFMDFMDYFIPSQKYSDNQKTME